MKKLGFDNDKYIRIQSEHIKERIEKFKGKLYLELGGKLFSSTKLMTHITEQLLTLLKQYTKALRRLAVKELGKMTP